MSKYRRPTLLPTSFVEDNTDDKYYYYYPPTTTSTISSTGVLYSQRQQENHRNNFNNKTSRRRRRKIDDIDAALKHNFYFPSLVAKYWTVLIEPQNEEEMIDPDHSALWKQIRSDREAVKRAAEQRHFENVKKKINSQRGKMAVELRTERQTLAKQQPVW